MYAAVPRTRPNWVAVLADRRRAQRVDRDRRGRIERFRQTEIEHLNGAVLPHLDVGGFQVAMDDAALVGGFQSLGNLSGDGDRVLERQGPFEATLRKRAPIHQLENNRGRGQRLLRLRSDLFESVDLRDVDVIERCEQCASRRKRMTRSVSAANVSGRIFSATSRLSRVSRAR